VDITHHPKLIHPTAYVAPNATIVGEVHVAARVSIWFSSVLRGDNAPIIIGERTNVQDLSMIHADEGEPCELGVGVTVGHRAVLHSATVKDGVGGDRGRRAEWGGCRPRGTGRSWRIGDQRDDNPTSSSGAWRASTGGAPAHRRGGRPVAQIRRTLRRTRAGIYERYC
jgi:hypothetical protein